MVRIEGLRRRIAKAERRIARGIDRRAEKKTGEVSELEIKERLTKILTRLLKPAQNGREAA